MAGTRAGGLLAAASIKANFGDDFYFKIGSKGGKKRVPKGFALMSPEKRSKAVKKGGKISRRDKAKFRLEY